MSKENWKDIVGYEGSYQVSNFGNVRKLDTVETQKNGRRRFRKGRLLTPKKHNMGYLRSELWKNGKMNSFYIHRLVAEAFVDNPNGKPEVNHLDGDKKNNHFENLEWCTRSENECHSYNMGLQKKGEFNGNAKLTDEEATRLKLDIKSGKFTGIQLARKYNIHPSTVSAIKNGKFRI
ncbi:TPA: NUMOD4 motif-containing HNH endonuclease [Streptococcus suis]